MRNRPFPNLTLVKSVTIALVFGLIAGYYTQKPTNPQTASDQFLSAAASQPVQTDVTGTLIDQGQRRTYYLHTPPSYQPDQPLPLVLAFHESEGQGKAMAEHTGLNQLADQQGFIVVYPDGLNQKWNVSEKAKTGEDNVAFVHNLIAYIAQLRAIDHQRIYATGLSNGGILVQKLACEQPGEIAAFATVAASLPVQWQAQCQRQTPVSMLMINGTADDVVPWQGGEPPTVRVGRNLSIPPIPSVINFWQQHDGCTAPPTKGQLPNTHVTTTSYTNCQAGAEVTLIALQGATHIWPGGAYGDSAWLDAGQTIWSFFQRHSLPAVAQSPQAANGQTTAAPQ